MPLKNYSIVIPAKNEAQGLAKLLPELKLRHPGVDIIVVDDGSTDQTHIICEQAGVTVIKHPYSKGNGAAVKTGMKAVTTEVAVLMDGDGQHSSADVEKLVSKINQGFDMAVGERNASGQANFWRASANRFYNWLSSALVGQQILDLTSGFRAVRTELFNRYLPLLPNGFSYPTTITMSFFRSGLNVSYVPVTVADRSGQSHLRPFRDGIKFLLIIFKVTTLFSPLKVFFPIAVSHLASGLGYYLYTFLSAGRYTNMGVTLIISAIIIFLIGLISEQITTLTFASLQDSSDVEN